MKHNWLQQYDYHLWANEKIFKHLKELPREVYHEEIQSVFPSICEALVHIYNVDVIWLYVMSGNSFDQIMESMGRLSEETKGKTMGQLETMFVQLSERFKGFFNRQQDLETVISVQHPRYGALQCRYSDLVQHIVNHGTYHRGNITAMLRQLGYSGTPTDYVFYLYTLNQ